MMRLGRRVSLLTALFLLTSAATAHAECAWVLWNGRDIAGIENPTKLRPREWAWATKGIYPTRHDCYRGMRNAPFVSALKEMKVTTEDLEFGYGGRDWGDDEFLWDGNGVSLTPSKPTSGSQLSQWWSCQPQGKKPQRGMVPWE